MIDGAGLAQDLHAMDGPIYNSHLDATDLNSAINTFMSQEQADNVFGSNGTPASGTLRNEIADAISSANSGASTSTALFYEQNAETINIGGGGDGDGGDGDGGDGDGDDGCF